MIEIIKMKSNYLLKILDSELLTVNYKFSFRLNITINPSQFPNSSIMAYSFCINLF